MEKLSSSGGSYEGAFDGLRPEIGESVDWRSVADEANKGPSLQEMQELADQVNAQPNWDEVAEMANAQPDMQAIADEVNRGNDSFAALDEAGKEGAEPAAAGETTPDEPTAPVALDRDSPAAKAFEELSKM